VTSEQTSGCLATIGTITLALPVFLTNPLVTDVPTQGRPDLSTAANDLTDPALTESSFVAAGFAVIPVLSSRLSLAPHSAF
jgi:hypothetical protein